VYETGDGHVMILRSRSGRIVLWRIDADQQMHVWRMEPAGGMKQLTSGTGERLVDLSPDGKWFTYTVSDSTRGVWIMSTDGGEGRLVAPRAQPGIGSFSPDNQLVITLEYEADEKGFVRPVFKVTPIEGGEAVTTLRLPQRATDYEGRPGDGGAVTFIDNADPNRNVYVADIVDQAMRKVTQFTDGVITDHQWSDDGKRLAVVRRLPDGENVWILDRDGNKPVQATHFTRLDVVQVAWAPDNVHVVANAGQTSNDVVLVRNFR
jgi:Tol biopolymer transport system component